jgi:deoxyribonuclease V
VPLGVRETGVVGPCQYAGPTDRACIHRGVKATHGDNMHPLRLPEDFEALTLSEARALQARLAARVREETPRGRVGLIAGLDASYEPGQGRTHAAAVLWEEASGEVVEIATAAGGTHHPYVPGFLAWRELPALLAAFGKLAVRPDLVLVDGHGRAHPRRCGLACLVGLALDLPTAGCAKSVLVGGFSGLASARGARAALEDRGEVIGIALRTRAGVRPVYVSVGHRITLELACRQVLAASRFRIPEPLRAAHTAVTRLRA